MSEASHHNDCTDPLNHIEAPVTADFSVTRESLLQPPDWRYQEAAKYIRDERDGFTPTIPSDVLVQFTIRALRARQGNRRTYSTPNKLVRSLWPVMDQVLTYGLGSRVSSISAQMDACLIKGLRHREARLAGCPVSREVYDLYSKIFFDLTGIRAVHSWMQDYLFEPARDAKNTTLLRARLLAYHGEGSAGMNTSVIGMSTGREAELMKSLGQTERQKQLFDYIVQKVNLPIDIYANIMESALRNMTDHDFQEHMKDRDDAGSSSLEELANNMEQGIRAYSRSGDEPPDTSGLDFTNQYTKALTGK